MRSVIGTPMSERISASSSSSQSTGLPANLSMMFWKNLIPHARYSERSRGIALPNPEVSLKSSLNWAGAEVPRCARFKVTQPDLSAPPGPPSAQDDRHLLAHASPLHGRGASAPSGLGQGYH